MEKSASFIDAVREDDFNMTNGSPHTTYFPADTYSRPSNLCLTGKDVFWGPPLFPRSRMLTRIDGKGLMSKNLKNLISTEFFYSIQCYRKFNRMVKWHEGNQRFP